MNFHKKLGLQFARKTVILNNSYFMEGGGRRRFVKNSITCLKRPLKITKTKILMTYDSLMKVDNIAE